MLKKYTKIILSRLPFQWSLFFLLIHIVLSLSISSDSESKRARYKRNFDRVEEFKRNMSPQDDFQLHRYFGVNEELYLGMKARKAIQSIKKEAKLDESWRKKNDPIFTHYLRYEATSGERYFYKKNKALFFKQETGKELIQFLKKEAKK